MPRRLSVSLNEEKEGLHLHSKHFGEKFNYYVENARVEKELALILQVLAGKVHDLSHQKFIVLVMKLEGILIQVSGICHGMGSWSLLCWEFC